MKQNELRYRILKAAIALLFGVGLFAQEVQAQWVQATLQFPYRTGYWLDIMFLESDPNYGWACSLEGYVVRTTDAGDTWEGVIVTPDAAGPDLEHIQFLTPLIGYVSGPAGIFRSNDGGASWRNITPIDPNGEQGWGCYFINQNEGVYLVGGCATGIQAFYRTTNGGNTWTASYYTEPQSGLSDAIIERDGSGFAVSSGVLWQTFDYGQTWAIYSRTGSKVWQEELAISGESFLLPTSGVDCAGQQPGVGSLRFSTDNGRTFREFQTGANMFGTFLINETTGWGVGNNMSVFYTEDAGVTWELRNCGLTGNMDDIFFISDTLGWIAGDGLYKSNFNALRRRASITPADPVLEICEGDSVYVEATDDFANYRWSDGTVGQGRFITDSGVYIMRAYDSVTCLESRDTITVRLKPSVTPTLQSSNTTICEGDSVVIEILGEFVSRQWSSGETESRIVARETGTFTVTTVDSNGCVKESSISVVVNPNPEPEITANRSTTICKDEAVTLAAPPGFESYLWSNGSTEESITVTTEGDYSVVVVDANGCVGTSDVVTVTVLNVTNKVGINLASTGGVVIVPSHPVGEKACIDVAISNQSDSLDLFIRDPLLLGNVFCSIPMSQLPIVIPPNGTRTIQLCCAAIDSGMVYDTLIISDTCSPTILPVQSRGNTILYDGTSRCEVPTITTVFRAGTTHHLSAPFPQPANEFIQLQMSPKTSVSAMLVNSMGQQVATAEIVEETEFLRLIAPTHSLPAGPYMMVVQIEGAPVRSFPVSVIR